MTIFDEILNGVEHRFCLRHQYSNFEKKFGGGVVIRDLMMRAAKATFYPNKMDNNFGPKATDLNYSHPSTKHHLAGPKKLKEGKLMNMLVIPNFQRKISS